MSRIDNPVIEFSTFLGLAPAGISRNRLQIGENYHMADSTGIDPTSTPGLLAPGLKDGTMISDVPASTSSTPHTDTRVKKFFPTDVFGAQFIAYIEDDAFHIHSSGSTFDECIGGFPVTLGASGGNDELHDALPWDDFIFGSWVNTSSSDIAKVDIISGTSDPDFFSTRTGGAAMEKKYFHPILIAPNGFLYVADGPAVHKMDTYTTSAVVTISAIDLPGDWVICDILDYEVYMWIAAVYSPGWRTDNIIEYDPLERTASVFLWNYQSRQSNEFTGFAKEYKLSAVGAISSLFMHNSVPHLFTLGSNNKTQIRRFTGSDFSIIWEEPGNIMPIRGKGGIISRNGHITWMAQETRELYSYGTLSPNLPETFNNIGFAGEVEISGNFVNHDNQLGGAITMDTDGAIWAGWGYARLDVPSGIWLTYGEVRKMDYMYKSSYAMTITKQLPKLTDLAGITIYYPPESDTTASNTLTVRVYKNFSTTAVSGTEMVLTHAADLGRGWWYLPLGGERWKNFNAVSLDFTWSNTSGITQTFRPYRVDLEIATTTKKK